MNLTARDWELLHKRARDEFEMAFVPGQKRAREWIEDRIADCPRCLQAFVRHALYQAMTPQDRAAGFDTSNALDELAQDYADNRDWTEAEIAGHFAPEEA